MVRVRLDFLIYISDRDKGERRDVPSVSKVHFRQERVPGGARHWQRRGRVNIFIRRTLKAFDWLNCHNAVLFGFFRPLC